MNQEKREKDMNRRKFLSYSSLGLAGLSILPGCVQNNNVQTAPAVDNAVEKKIGLQIYSLGGELYEDLSGGLKKLKSYGYTDLELAGYNDGKIGPVEMSEFKKRCDDSGLNIVSTHVNPPVHEYNAGNRQQIMDFWKKAAEDHAAIGVKLLIQPGQPSTRSVEETSYVGEIFTEAGQIAKAAGMSFGFHNHAGEFARVVPGGKAPTRERKADSEVIYDCMLRNTDPSLVFFEMDVYWTVMGQQDPVEYMKKYADRIKVLHIKDRSVLGQSGMMNFEMIFKQAYTNGIKDYFVELEDASAAGITQFEGVKGCADYLLNASFVK